jgi:hypothetical protein
LIIVYTILVLFETSLVLVLQSYPFLFELISSLERRSIQYGREPRNRTRAKVRKKCKNFSLISGGSLVLVLHFTKERNNYHQPREKIKQTEKENKRE